MKATSTVVAVVTVVGAAAVLIANAVSGAINWTDMVTLAAAFTGFGLMGAVILRRHSRHRMGWLFVAILGFGLLNGFSGVALEVTNAPLVAALNDITWWPVSVLALVILPLWFPTGTAPTKRWRWVAWLAFVSLAAVITVDLVREDVCVRHATETTATVTEGDCLETEPNPLGVSGVVGAEEGPPGEFFLLGILVSIVGAFASLFVRYRRSHGVERLQLKWIVYAVSLVIAWAMIGDVFAIDVLGRDDVLFGDTVGSLIFGTGLVGIPVAAGIAITRYRLYDIERIINKTVVYGVLVVVISVVFAAVVFVPVALAGGDISGEEGSLWWSLLATVILVLVLTPLRDRVQRGANRLVYGRRASPYEALSGFSATVSGSLATEELLVRMAEILAEGTGAEYAQVWVVSGDDLHLAASHGTVSSDLEAPVTIVDGRVVTTVDPDCVAPVVHQGEVLGALLIGKEAGETLRPIEERLMADLASHAGVVLRNFRLTDELLARLDELQASRQRLVTAQDEERRRLERNLHDGAQQQLVALKIKLSILDGVTDAGKRSELLATLLADTDDAIQSLRDLARGIYPPTLAQEGLEVALRAQATKAAIAIEVVAEGVGRYSPEVEAAVYYCTLEALQNVAKYANASAARVTLAGEDGCLRFEVTDDGAGFDTSKTRRGAGLQNMEDRLGAFGGTVDITSSPGQGTTVSGEVTAQLLDRPSR